VHSASSGPARPCRSGESDTSSVCISSPCRNFLQADNGGLFFILQPSNNHLILAWGQQRCQIVKCRITEQRLLRS
jgi:hypothetical protein